MSMPPLYLTTVVFNPMRFRSRINLYRKFAAWVASYGVKMITVEVAYGNRPFEVTEFSNPYHLQLRSSADLWHKERALNLGIQRLCQLHPEWQYVAYLDADVKLMRDDWAEELVHLLQHYAVVQCFGEVATLDPSHHRLYGGKSIARNFHEAGGILAGKSPATYTSMGWPGLGWAYRRDEFEKVGRLFDVSVAGSGDTHMAGAYMGHPELGLRPEMSKGFRRAVMRYSELCDKYVKGNVSFLPTMLVHSWHGKAKDRGYSRRNQALARFQFDPYEDLVVDAQGLYTWADHSWKLSVAMRQTMQERNEDSVDVD